MKSQILFDAESHTYSHLGVPVPSVTTVLKDVGMIDFSAVRDDVLLKAMERGTGIHKALEMINKGEAEMDWFETHRPDLAPYLASAMKFQEEMRVQFIEMEVRVFHERLLYAGTLDAIARINGVDYVLDFKSGSPQRWHSVQLAAYESAYTEDEDWPAHAAPMGRACVYLSPGKYRFNEYIGVGDFDVFFSALRVFNFKRRG